MARGLGFMARLRLLVRWALARYGGRVVRVALVGLSVVVLVAIGGVAAAESRAPGVMLWAWERAEHLETIDPTTTGVAFLARTIRLDGAALRVVPRRQPLLVPPGTHLVAVVRVEPPRRRDAAPVAVAARYLAAAIAAVARPGVAGVQIDFDAPRSLRPFYRETLHAVRAALPASTELSMTALASWTFGDAWVDDLPVDDVVPMLFRMGADDRLVRRRLAAGDDFAARRARASVGLALDEERPEIPAGRRLYLFSAQAWSPARASDALAEVRRWQDERTAAR